MKIGKISLFPVFLLALCGAWHGGDLAQAARYPGEMYAELVWVGSTEARFELFADEAITIDTVGAKIFEATSD